MDFKEAKAYIKADIENYLSLKGIDVKKSFCCLNPAHEDKNPSMRLDKKRKKAHCFVCGADYDTFDLIGIDYGLASGSDIFKKGYELYGFHEGHKISFEKRKQKCKTKDEKTDTENLGAFFKKAAEALSKTDYLERRGISQKTATRFGLGYVESWQHPTLSESMKKIIPPSPRLIIPTGDGSYLARDVRDVIPSEQAKYAKSKVGKVQIFNLKALYQPGELIFLTEGELDALSIIEAGEDAIALGSTSNANNFIAFCSQKHPFKTILLALDNDKSGKQAQEIISKSLQELKIACTSVDICSPYKDPNEALVEAPEAFLRALREAKEGCLKTVEREGKIMGSVTEYLGNFIEEIIEKNICAIPTGFPKLDKCLDGGLYPGLYILGGGSSLGKTSWACQMTDNIAKTGKDVLFVSLEMSRKEILAKSISRNTLIKVLEEGKKADLAKSVNDILSGSRYKNYSDEEVGIIQAATQMYCSYGNHIFIMEGEGEATVSTIRKAALDQMSVTGNVPVIIVDYLQILSPLIQRSTDKQKVDKSVLELKRLSRDLETTVFVLSSLSRSTYTEEVDMHSYKESGNIEYSADVLLGLDMKGVGNKTFDIGKAKRENPRAIEISIIKSRNSEVGGRISCRYYPKFNYIQEG